MKKFSNKLLLLAALALPLTAHAYDFMVDGLCYNINSDSTSVTVTYQNNSSPRYSNLSGSLVIPESVTLDGIDYMISSIDILAFSGCSNITSVSIPNTVISIGRHAFNECSSLSLISIPNSVSSIGTAAFSGTSWFNNQPNGLVYAGLVAYGYKGTMPTNSYLSIIEGTKGIAADCFSNCSGLTLVSIPSSVIFIGEGAFSGCIGLASINVNEGNLQYDSRNNCNAIIETSSNTLIAGCKSTVIPSTVTSVANRAFYGCNSLTSINIPNSITHIGRYSFFGCNGVIGTLIIPNSVISIGECAFTGCNKLEYIVVDNENSKYDSRNNCNALIETESNTLIHGCKNTIIPNSVSAIGYCAFNGCTGLTNLTIPNSVTSIGDDAFENCAGLMGTLNIPNSVISIGNWAFGGCYGLSSVDIGHHVTTIGFHAFTGCTGITTLTIPSSVTSIGNQAFASCRSLSRIDAYPDPTNVSLGGGVFFDVPKNNVLHVLPKYIEAYRTADQWKEFSEITADLSTSTGDVNYDGVVDVRDITTLIDMIMGNTPTDFYSGDLSGNGTVNVIDITLLIDIIMSN